MTAWGLQSSSPSARAEKPLFVKQQTKFQVAVPAVKPQVKLLSAGVEPRQELRFKPPVNVRQTAIMTMNMDMAMSMAGQPMPTVKLPATVITMNAVVTQVDPNGDIHFKCSYSNADVVGNSTVPPKVLEAMRSQFKKIAGMSGSFIVDNRGQNKGGNFVFLQEIDAQLKQQISDSLNQISSPLPEEAIGIGARWQTTSLANFRGMKATQTATYELVNLQDGVVTLNVSVQQQAQPQTLKQPGLPSGATLTLRSLNSQGKGQVIVPLNQLFPIRSRLVMNANSQMAVKQAGKAEETTMDAKMQMQLDLDSK